MHRSLIPALAVLAAACTGSDPDTPASCAYAVTQDLDAGRFDAALARLDSRACEAALTAEQLEINRAAAYIGKAGYDVADLLLAVLDSNGDGGATDADVRLLEALTGLGGAGGLRFLGRANIAYQRMVTAFQAGLDEACRDANVLLLSELQRDACFNSGMLAYARLTRGFDLLLGNELAAFLGLTELDCGNDRNASGTPDEAEITACALQARTRLDSGGGVCLEPGNGGDASTVGGITWSRIPGVPAAAFFEDSVRFTDVVPIRVTTQAGGTCEGARTDLRLIQPRPGRSAEVLVTSGLCETEITQSCPAAWSELGCWPCPIPRDSGGGAVSLADTLLDTVNVQAERLLGVLTDEDRAQIREDLDEMRMRFCEPVEGSSEACEDNGSGIEVNRAAIREYLRQ